MSEGAPLESSRPTFGLEACSGWDYNLGMTRNNTSWPQLPRRIFNGCKAETFGEDS